MIIDKPKAPQEQPKEPIIDVSIVDERYKTEEEVIAGNPLEDLYYAVSDIIKGIKEDPDDPNSKPLFKTVKWNMGQLNRLRHTKNNTEYAMAFPLCLIHFINVYWNLGYNKVGQAYGEMRICYVLNRLNTLDDQYQTEGVRVAKRIIEAINDNLDIKLAPLTSRFQLSYWDQVESFEKGVQQFWLTYEVRCNDYSSYRRKKYKPVYLVAPPFTNFSDMSDEHNVDKRENVNRPIEEAVKVTKQIPETPGSTTPDTPGTTDNNKGEQTT